MGSKLYQIDLNEVGNWHPGLRKEIYCGLDGLIFYDHEQVILTQE